MATCVGCWDEAYFQSRARGGTQAERYAEQLELHPEHGLHSCGYDEDSFACKIRHLQINTGAAKAADNA